MTALKCRKKEKKMNDCILITVNIKGIAQQNCNGKDGKQWNGDI